MDAREAIDDLNDWLRQAELAYSEYCELFPGFPDFLEVTKWRAALVAPIPMILFCPKCGLQHVDEPDERTPDWSNPPHRSHLCHGCGHIWRPADVPTEGVAAIQTKGKADSPPVSRAAYTPTPEEIEAAKTPSGGWTKETLARWGVAWPPPKGWRKKLESRPSQPSSSNE